MQQNGSFTGRSRTNRQRFTGGHRRVNTLGQAEPDEYDDNDNYQELSLSLGMLTGWAAL